MQSVPREWLDFLRQQFPKDSRIQLTEIGGNPRPISPGSTGKLDYIDDAGQFHVKWDNGCTLALVLGEDRFSVYLPEPQTFKLYMPLTADFYGRDEWGDMSEDGEEWDGHTLMDYEGQILSALVKNRVPEENESGLMRWYGEDDSVDHKVRSAVFTVEVRNRQLWGVAECRVAGELTPEELTILKEYLGGQASDGWGEGFEQRPIEVDGGELYVHLWQPDDWSIQTEQERFAPKVAEGLPELCFSTLRTTGQLICIKRGETGYYPSDWDTGDKEGNVELADELNEDLGVTPIQRQAIIEMDEIPAIQELLKDAKSFCCYGFDCYERYWDITDEEYLAQLETKREEITHEILERCRTKRKNLYITGPVALNVAQKFSVHRLCDKEGKHNLANRFVGELMEQLVQDGLLVTTKTRNGPGVRTATDAEISSPLPGQQQMTL